MSSLVWLGVLALLIGVPVSRTWRRHRASRAEAHADNDTYVSAIDAKGWILFLNGPVAVAIAVLCLAVGVPRQWSETQRLRAQTRLFALTLECADGALSVGNPTREAVDVWVLGAGTTTRPPRLGQPTERPARFDQPRGLHIDPVSITSLPLDAVPTAAHTALQLAPGLGSIIGARPALIVELSLAGTRGNTVVRRCE